MKRISIKTHENIPNTVELRIEEQQNNQFLLKTECLVTEKDVEHVCFNPIPPNETYTIWSNEDDWHVRAVIDAYFDGMRRGKHYSWTN